MEEDMKVLFIYLSMNETDLGDAPFFLFFSKKESEGNWGWGRNRPRGRGKSVAIVHPPAVRGEGGPRP